MSIYNTTEKIDFVAESLPDIVRRLREKSPNWKSRAGYANAQLLTDFNPRTIWEAYRSLTFLKKALRDTIQSELSPSDEACEVSA